MPRTDCCGYSAGKFEFPTFSFIRWERLASRQVPREPIFPVAPDLAIEILSPGNTQEEMSRKLRDYFAAGVRLVWYIDPGTRIARAYTAEDQVLQFGATGVLAAGEVLPGFELPLGRLFAMLDRVAGYEGQAANGGA